MRRGGAGWYGALAILMLSGASALVRRRFASRRRTAVLASAGGAQTPAPAATTAATAAPAAKRSRAPAPLLGPIDLLFLGTCSSAPSSTRNQQSAALRVGGDTWLFDCGESTQRQMLFAKWRTSSITRVFITHMHGDHVFGLPGILCNVGSATGEGKHHVTIVGPPGLRAWLRCTLLATYSTLGPCTTYSVHELIGLQASTAPPAAADAAADAAAEPPARAPTAGASAPQPEHGGLSAASVEPLHACERPGDDLAPDARGVWTVPRTQSDPPMQVFAAELTHRVPTVGFVAVEDARPGGLDARTLLPILAREGVPASALRALKGGEPLALPSGRTLNPSDWLEPPTARKLAILGDLSAASDGLCALAAGCDVLVHEATSAFLKRDAERLAASREAGGATTARTAKAVEQLAIGKGHSTPQMAGRLAARVGAKHLALWHFSAKYSGAADEQSLEVMEEIAALAHAHAGGAAVIAARDLMTLTVGIKGELSVKQPAAEPEAEELAAGST